MLHVLKLIDSSAVQKTLNQILKYLFVAFIIVFPSFFITSFVNIFDLSKVVFLVGFVVLVFAFVAFELATQSKLTFKLSGLDLPLLAFVLVFVLSAVLKTPNKIEAFMSPGTVTVVIASFLLYFFAKMVFGEDKKQFALSLFFSGVLVSLMSILAFTGVFAKVPQLPAFMKDVSFSPLGGKLPEIMFLIVLIPFGAYLILQEKDLTRKIFYGLSAAIVVLSLILSISLILPGKPGSPILADYQTSWSIAIDTLKVSPLWGIGPNNYLTAFSRFLPISYNQTSYWAVRFSSARSFVLTLTTETGILGLLTFVLILFGVFKKHLKNFAQSLSNWNKAETAGLVSMLLLVVGLLLFPASSVLLVLFFLLAYLNTDSSDVTFNLSATGFKNGNIFVSKIPALVFSLVILVGLSTLGFFSWKALAAERSYKLAIDAITKNDAKTAYTELGKAISNDPYVDRYHATYDQLSLALARSVAQKTNITDADKNTVAQLVQQSIAEAKATVALNPLRSSNWELLARTYQTIIPFAQGADNFTIQTYTQAIALDPINPNLRISLGGVYYALGRYDDAINTFTLAAAAKPDLANAHYNLAVAYRDKKETDKAITEMNTVLTLVQPNSQDYATAKAELDNLQKNKAAAKPSSSDNLTAPQPAQTSNIKPPITLPKEATPPANP